MAGCRAVAAGPPDHDFKDARAAAELRFVEALEPVAIGPVRESGVGHARQTDGQRGGVVADMGLAERQRRYRARIGNPALATRAYEPRSRGSISNLAPVAHDSWFDNVRLSAHELPHVIHQHADRSEEIILRWPAMEMGGFQADGADAGKLRAHFTTWRRPEKLGRTPTGVPALDSGGPSRSPQGKSLINCNKSESRQNM